MLISFKDIFARFSRIFLRGLENCSFLLNVEVSLNSQIYLQRAGQFCLNKSLEPDWNFWNLLKNPFPSTGLLSLDYKYDCPVPACVIKGIHLKTKRCLRRHWIEQHEAMSEHFTCVMCDSTSKRKNDLFKHAQRSHPGLNGADAFGPMQYQTNKKFIDP